MPAGTNIKLWVSDPRNPTVGLIGAAVFICQGSNPCIYTPSSAGGFIFASISDGTYLFDITEPDGLSSVVSRKAYTVVVSGSSVTVTGRTPNADGVFVVTMGLIPVVNPMVAELQQRIIKLASFSVAQFKSISACQLVDQVNPVRGLNNDLSAGFPKVTQRLPSSGRIKALIVPVDFSDIKGTDETVNYFTPVANGVKNFYFKQSYGTVAFDFDIVPQWIRAPFTSTKFGTGGSVGAGDPGGYLNAIIALTDGAIDYSGYDAVYFLVPKEMPMANMGWGPAITYPHWTSNGVIMNGATGGADMYFNENNGIKGGRWKWMAHETGHAFGLFDEDYKHQSQTLGFWGIMAMSWSNHAIELGAWDRYLQGWLPDSEVSCLEPSALTVQGETIKISPIVRQDHELKSIMVPISSSKILVIESRKSESLDVIPAGKEGVLIYTVDMTKGQLGGGYETIRRAGSTDPYFEDAPLRSGESIIVAGLKILVKELSSSGDTITISKA